MDSYSDSVSGVHLFCPSNTPSHMHTHSHTHTHTFTHTRVHTTTHAHTVTQMDPNTYAITHVHSNMHGLKIERTMNSLAPVVSKLFSRVRVLHTQEEGGPTAARDRTRLGCFDNYTCSSVTGLRGPKERTPPFSLSFNRPRGPWRKLNVHYKHDDTGLFARKKKPRCREGQSRAQGRP